MHDLHRSLRGASGDAASIWRKHIPLHSFRHLFGRADLAFVSLQPGLRPTELELLRRNGIPIHFDATELFGDFEDVAALVGAVDVYAGVSSTQAHLAAAMGQRTFVLLNEDSHTIWELNRRRPVYPNAHVVQRTLQDRGDGTFDMKYHADWTREIDEVSHMIGAGPTRLSV